MARRKEIPELGLVGTGIVCKMLGMTVPRFWQFRNQGKFIPHEKKFSSKKFPLWRRSAVERFIEDIKK